jgi:hypothetical protein
LTAASVFSTQNLLRSLILHFDDANAVRFGTIGVIAVAASGVNQLRLSAGACATHAAAGINLCDRDA